MSPSTGNGTQCLFGEPVKQIEYDDKVDVKLDKFHYELFKHFIPDLTTQKKNILKNDHAAEKDLAPFIINKFFSMDSGDIFLSNEMNRYCGLPRRMVYDFYIYGAAKRKRYNKWAKNSKDDLVDFIKDTLNMSHQKALIAAELIDDVTLDRLKQSRMIGGIKK